MRPRIRVCRCLALGLLPALTGCGPEPPSRPLPGPLLIVAVDALEPDVVLPLLAEGELEHLAALMRAGTFGVLRTRTEARSPRIWTTIATGKPPAAHGITGFTFVDEAGERRLFTSEHRRTKAYWNILGDHDVASATIGWWVTFPAEPVLGLMVAQTNTLAERESGLFKGTLHADVDDQVWPPERTAWVLAELRRSEAELDEQLAATFGPSLRELEGEAAERWSACRWAFRADSTYLRVARALGRDGPPPVTAVYVGGTDIVGHRFWAAQHPEAFGLPTESEEVRRFGDVVRAYYRYVDAELGRLLAAWPPDTTVWVLSDHGMAAEPMAFDEGERFDPGLSGGHSAGEPGLFVACGPGVPTADPSVDPARLTRADLPWLGDVLDVCPTLLAFLGVPLGEDMPGKPMAALFDRAHFADRRPTYVPTHDDEAWRAERSARGTQPRGAEERLEQLRKLGYLEAETAPRDGR